MNADPIGIALPANLFQGKTAIVTGSSRGVGRATAVRLAEGGSNVQAVPHSTVLFVAHVIVGGVVSTTVTV